jgi:hypothetical protein
LYECTKELVLSTKKRRTILRAAAILAVFALKKNFEFGWKPVHILEINAVSVGATLRPAGLEASRGVISVNYSKDPAPRLRYSRAPILRRGSNGVPRRSSCALRRPPFRQFHCHDRANGDLQTDAQPTGALQTCKNRIHRLTSGMWLCVGGLFYRPTIFALSATQRDRRGFAESRRGVGPDPALTGWS